MPPGVIHKNGNGTVDERDQKIAMFYFMPQMANFMFAVPEWVLERCLVSLVLLVGVLYALGRQRIADGFGWPGLSWKRVGTAGVHTLICAIFLYAATPSLPLSAGIGWYSFGVGVWAFNVFTTLWPRNVQPETSSRRQSAVEMAVMLFFMCAWLSFVGFVYFSGAAMRDGSKTPTTQQTAPWSEQGRTVYITPTEKQRIQILEYAGEGGIMICVGGGLILALFDKLRRAA